MVLPLYIFCKYNFYLATGTVLAYFNIYIYDYASVRTFNRKICIPCRVNDFKHFWQCDIA